MLLIDIDRFKGINDSHGHAAGDAVLAHVSRLIRAETGPGGLIGRLGGDEIAVYLPKAAVGVGANLATRLCERMAALPVLLAGGERLAVTTSIGCTAGTAREGLSDLLARADAAMYRAKQSGRNRAECGCGHDASPTRAAA